MEKSMRVLMTSTNSRLVIVCTLTALTACISPSEKRQMRDDLFSAQTRILTLEKQLTDTSKKAENTGATSSKKIASTQADMDKLVRDIQLLKGEIDSLKNTMRTGVVPGEEGNTNGVTLQSLADRVQTVEQAQEELLEALNKAGVKKPKGSDRKVASNLKDLKSDYDAKKYKNVIDDAAAIVKKESGNGKNEAKDLWAEAYFKLGKMRDAALKFNDLADSKPSSEMMPIVKMRLGDCFRNLGDPATAKIYYEELISDFPSTDEAVKAKERLAELEEKDKKQG
jgi:TolA-binding protein